MSDLSSWLLGCKERLEKLTAGSTTRFADQEWVIRLRYHPWSFSQENRDEVAALLETRSADLAVALAVIEAVERLANDWERTFPRNEPSRELRAAMLKAYEEAKA